MFNTFTAILVCLEDGKYILYLPQKNNATCWTFESNFCNVFRQVLRSLWLQHSSTIKQFWQLELAKQERFLFLFSSVYLVRGSSRLSILYRVSLWLKTGWKCWDFLLVTVVIPHSVWDAWDMPPHHHRFSHTKAGLCEEEKSAGQPLLCCHEWELIELWSHKNTRDELQLCKWRFQNKFWVLWKNY